MIKSKFAIPTIAFCIGSSLLAGSVRANDHTSRAGAPASIDQKNTVNASQLLHSRVLDKSGQKIGDVEDIIVDQNSGRAQFAVIKLSGDLADKGKFAPVPFTLLKFNDSDRKDSFGHRDLTLQVDREKLLAASRFSARTWPNSDAVTWGPEVYSYYGVPWNGANAGATGSAFSSSAGTGNSDVVVQESYPAQSRTYIVREYSVDADKPIDNGTGPDGRDTFHFLPRPWPYNEMQAGATGPSFSSSVGASDNTTVTVRDYQTTDNSRVVIQDTYPSRTYRTYEYRTYGDKPIDNGNGPDGRDTFRFTPRPWPYHDTTDAH